MVEQGNDFVIKKETMIKKNLHDIKEVYEMESVVSLTLFTNFYLRNWEVDLMGLCTKRLTEHLDKKEQLR